MNSAQPYSSYGYDQNNGRHQPPSPTVQTYHGSVAPAAYAEAAPVPEQYAYNDGDERATKPEQHSPASALTNNYDQAEITVSPTREITLVPRIIYIASVSAAIGGFLFGYDTGTISSCTLAIKEYFNMTTITQEVLTSSVAASAALVALFGGTLNFYFGRRKVILLAAAVYFVGALINCSASTKGALVFGRIIIGAAIGLEFATVPIYIAEIAPSEIRGRLVTFSFSMVTFGQFIANFIQALFGLNTGDSWRVLMGLAALPAAAQFIIFLWMPESPRWLVISGREEDSKQVLTRLRAGEIGAEFEQVAQSARDSLQSDLIHSYAPILIHMIRVPTARKALIVGCGLQMFQQLLGFNTIMYYTSVIIRMSGVHNSTRAAWLGVLLSAVNFTCTMVCLWLIERIGRRPLILISLGGAILSLILVAVGFETISSNSPPITWSVPGMGPIPWAINSEIYPIWARSTGMATATFINWLSCLIVSSTFISLTDTITRHGAFWLYTSLAVVGFIFTYIVVPETQGRRLEELETIFARPWLDRNFIKERMPGGGSGETALGNMDTSKLDSRGMPNAEGLQY